MNYHMMLTLQAEGSNPSELAQLAANIELPHGVTVNNININPMPEALFGEQLSPVEVEVVQPEPATEPEPEAEVKGSEPAPKAMAKAKELAKEHGIDWVELFPGSGKDGMVRQDDVRKAIKLRQAQQASGDGEKVEFSDVRQALSQFVQKFEDGKVRAKELLQRYGAERVSALAEDQYAAFLAEVKEQLGG